MAATLTSAVKRGDVLACVEALFKRAPLDTVARIEDWEGPVLHCALSEGHLDVSKLLVVAGADLAAEDNMWRQPLLWAGELGHTDLAAGMLDRGANLEASTSDGTALNLAAENGHRKTVEMLLDRGACLETSNWNGCTPLIQAVCGLHLDTITLLLDRGADIAHADKEGLTAYDHAQQHPKRVATLGAALVARLKPPSPAAVAATHADAAEAVGTAALNTLQSGLRRAAMLTLATFSVAARDGHRSISRSSGGCDSAVFRAVLRAARAAGGDGVAAAAAPLTLKAILNVYEAIDLAPIFEADCAVYEDGERWHPNVVKCLGHFTDTATGTILGQSIDGDVTPPRALFIVMECLGTPLKQLISDRLAARARDAAAAGSVLLSDEDSVWPPVLSVAACLLILQRLLRAVCHLLARGVVHRSIMPDNVLLAMNELGEMALDATPTVVKLAGLCEVMDMGTDGIPYVCRDTPLNEDAQYLAPEVTEPAAGSGRRAVDIDYSKNDVFAVGMVAHYMLTSGTQRAFSANHPDYSETTYTQLPQRCPAPIAELVWAMVNPSFEHRITAEEALERVNSLIELPRLEWGVAQTEVTV